MTEEELFANAIELSSSEDRMRYVQEACGGDVNLRAKVLDLLNAHEQADSLLDAPAHFGQQILLPSSDIAVGAGARIGPYELLEQIGEGGFGVVFLAEQSEPIRRRVAIKIIKPGMDSKEVVARFEVERQALAMMDHPNIAKVLDAGSVRRRPYFVMELVPGVPITEFCDKHNISTSGRLKLIAQVCSAVQHAHQKGVIHRDIKPGNVLVALQDGVGVPRVIDFGIAKALNERLTEKTVFTRLGQIVGTPQYMSPEQAELSGSDVDTRSDVYSLGVLLYELLTGCPPFDEKTLREAGLHEMFRMIREQEPPTPSQRLRTLDDASVSLVATHRDCQPRALRRRFRGDLDWIVMKALEKDRDRRYETPMNLADDIRRHLAKEPVMAGPPSLSRQLWKACRRHRAAATVLVCLAGSLLFGFALSTYGFIKARAAEQEALEQHEAAEAEAARVRQTRDFVVSLLANSTRKTIAGDDFAVASVLRELLDDPDQLRDEPTLQVEVLLTLGRIEFFHGEDASANTRFRRAWEILARIGQTRSLPAAECLRHRGHQTTSTASLQQAVQIERSLLGGKARYRTLAMLGHVLRQESRIEEADQVLREACGVFDGRHNPPRFCENPFAVRCALFRDQGDSQAAGELRRKGVSKLLGSFQWNVAAWKDRGIAFFDKDAFDDAQWCLLPASQKMIPSDEYLYKVDRELVQTYRWLGDYEAATMIAQRHYQRCREHLGHDQACWAACVCARVFVDLRDFDHAEEWMNKAIDHAKARDSYYPFQSLWIPYEFGLWLRQLNKPDDANQHFQFTGMRLQEMLSRGETAWRDWSADRTVYAQCLLFAGMRYESEKLRAELTEAGRRTELDRVGRGFVSSAMGLLEEKEGNIPAAIDAYTIAALGRSFKRECGYVDWPEDRLLALLSTHADGATLERVIDQLVLMRDKHMPQGHPGRGLALLRYGAALMDWTSSHAKAEQLLLEAQRVLQLHPLVPASHRRELAERLGRLKSLRPR